MINEIPTILTIVGGYILTSAFFFRYPTLIHRKKSIKFIAKHISHRGGAGEYYENTITACKRAQELGTDMLEIDCHITKDKQVVVFHDSNLRRLTGIDSNVSDLNYNELPLLKSVVSVDFVPGYYYKNENSNMADRRIPLLEEMFKMFVNVPMNIDIKTDDDELICEVSKLITRYNRENYCVWGNANCIVNDKCFEANPKVNLFFSKKRVFMLFLYYYSGLLPFMPIKETHLEIFLPSIYTNHPDYQKFGVISKLMLQFFDYLMIRKSLFLHLRRRGIQVYVWVLNEEKEFEKAFKAGATGVMTDFPTKLSTFMRENEILIQEAQSLCETL
ncbi:lysophospholipase D GDPD1-like [Planococcus citri]|uniref:lysophospholipase D GDPD1-like n=1 Tax=Planococcus citri TaxID=170843 RepID=UPI0031FA11AE